MDRSQKSIVAACVVALVAVAALAVFAPSSNPSRLTAAATGKSINLLTCTGDISAGGSFGASSVTAVGRSGRDCRVEIRRMGDLAFPGTRSRVAPTRCRIPRTGVTITLHGGDRGLNTAPLNTYCDTPH